jgi:hypothetical protein
MRLSWGDIFAGTVLLLQTAAVVGYSFSRNWKPAAFWAIATIVEAVVTWKLR